MWRKRCAARVSDDAVAIRSTYEHPWAHRCRRKEYRWGLCRQHAAMALSTHYAIVERIRSFPDKVI